MWKTDIDQFMMKVVGYCKALITFGNLKLQWCKLQ